MGKVECSQAGLNLIAMGSTASVLVYNLALQGYSMKQLSGITK